MITGVVHTEEGASFLCAVLFLRLVKHLSLGCLLLLDEMLLAVSSCLFTIDFIDQ